MILAVMCAALAACSSVGDRHFGYCTEADNELVPIVVNDPLTDTDVVIYVPRVQALWLEQNPAQVIEVLETRVIRVGTVWQPDWVKVSPEVRE